MPIKPGAYCLATYQRYTVVYKQKSNKNEKQKGRSATQKLQKHKSMESTAQ